jgi:uncharacterized protein YjbI with pentapeptide repeats
MANPEHLKTLKQGAAVWNKSSVSGYNWFVDLKGASLADTNLSHADLSRVDLSEADMTNADLTHAILTHTNLTRTNLTNANLSSANLSGANLYEANLSSADMTNADFSEASLISAKIVAACLRSSRLNNAYLINADISNSDLQKANLHNTRLLKANLSAVNLSEASLLSADLRGALLQCANITDADLTNADLSGANLVDCFLVNTKLFGVKLINTNLSRATISNCNIYGVSAWNVDVKDMRRQEDLRVTPGHEPAVYVDNLELAQFVYLLLHNEKIRSVIDTTGVKGVLLLGRFTPERKAVLDVIRKKLREFGFVPMRYDLEKPTQRDFTETIKTLAGMSRFIIADITNPKSAPLELKAILPHYMIPLVPILKEDEKPFAMFRDLAQEYRQWVLPRLEYDTPENLSKTIDKAMINRALKLADELRLSKAQERQALR